jgi:hypothetical protein
MGTDLRSLAVADAKKTASPIKSGNWPQRFAGVRILTHASNSGLAARFAFRSVTK